MRHIKGNRVAPLFPGTCQQTSEKNEILGEEQISKSSFPGIIEKHCHHLETGILCDERNDRLQIKDFSHHEQNCKGKSHPFTQCSGDVDKPYAELSGTCLHCTKHDDTLETDSRVAAADIIPFPCHGLPTAQNGILRQPQHMMVVHQRGEQWTPEYPSHEKKEDHRKNEKNIGVPLCPSCQTLTVRVFSVPYQNSVYKQSGDDQPCPVSRHQSKIPLQIKPSQASAKSSLMECADYLKCFVCTCPTMQETALCKHYYALSMICWLAVIVTIIIVVATTVHSV
ncbi:uncharacterized protein RB166_017888 [Leptodactylus fuscus]